MCILEDDEELNCTKLASTVTKEVIGAGVGLAGQDYLAAVKGTLTVIDQFAHPVCKTMNGIDFDDSNDIEFWLRHGRTVPVWDWNDQYSADEEDFGLDADEVYEHENEVDLEEDPRYYDKFFLH